jgi:hypothetical protein
MKKLKLILLSLLFGCEQIDLTSPFERNYYVIRKGQHYANFRGIAVADNGIYGTFAFLNVPIEEHEQINKLVGLSHFNVHDNSVRFGWWYKNGLFHIYLYVYQDGARSWSEIGSVKVLDVVKYSIHFRDGYCYVNVLNDKFSFEMPHCRFVRLPYYGGNIPAPNDIEISISINRY